MKQAQIGSKKVRLGDKVVVIAGNNRGQVGTVIACAADRVLVQGVNLRKKAVRRSEQSPRGGFVEIERPIHVSNVSPCDASGNPVRLRVVVDEAGNKSLCYQKDGQQVTYRSMKRSADYQRRA